MGPNGYTSKLKAKPLLDLHPPTPHTVIFMIELVILIGFGGRSSGGSKTKDIPLFS